MLHIVGVGSIMQEEYALLVFLKCRKTIETEHRRTNARVC